MGTVGDLQKSGYSRVPNKPIDGKFLEVEKKKKYTLVFHKQDCSLTLILRYRTLLRQNNLSVIAAQPFCYLWSGGLAWLKFSVVPLKVCGVIIVLPPFF